MGKAKAVKYRFKLGDVVECQGARLKVIGLIKTKNNEPAYEMVSPNTKGEPWLVNEISLETSRKVRGGKL